MMNDAGSNPWEDLATEESPSLNTRKFHKSFYWGVDKGTYLLIWELSKKYNDISFKRIKGDFSKLLKIEHTTRDNKTHLFVKLTNVEQWSIFKTFCQDLIAAVDEFKIEDQKIEFFITRLLDWKKFWNKSKSKTLSAESIKGLLGELKFLEEFLLKRISGYDAIRAWVGPNPNPQDFSYNKNTYEIKTHDESVQQITISSKEQLTKNTAELYLVVYSLSASNEPLSLNLIDYIKEIKKKLNNNECDMLDQKLINVGYSYDEVYKKFGYMISAPKFYKVADDFPKITTSNVHASIMDLTYKIPLNVIQQFRLEEDVITL